MSHNKMFFSGGFLFNPKTNSILLHKRDANTKYNASKWAFFGGKSEGDEKPIETFLREMKEELDIEISERQAIPLCDYLNEEFNTHRYIYYVESDLKKDEMTLGEGVDFNWIPVEKVFDYDSTEKTKKDLEFFLRYIEGGFKHLKLIRPINWEYVFDEWRKGEEYQESWQAHWKERGYGSWADWRGHYVAPLHPEKLKWLLYEIEKPTEALPNFYGVPTKAWIKKSYEGKTTKRLKDIYQLPILAENKKTGEIMKNFPKETLLVAISHKGRIILIEGMHRSLALANWSLPEFPKSKVFLVMAEWNEEEVPILGSAYKE